MLGLANRNPGIGDYLGSDPARPLEGFLAETPFPNLRFLAGDGRMPFMANLSYAQKQRLKRELLTLPAHYLLLDLGAGSHFNILDLFRIADSGLLITTPEHASVFSMLVFVKNLVLRSVERALRSEPELVDLLQVLYDQPIRGPALTLESWKERLRSTSAEAADEVDEICRRLRPRLIYNMGDTPDDLHVIPNIDATLERLFSIECDHLGFIFHHAEVRRVGRKQQALQTVVRNGPTATSIRQIARRIELYWDHPILSSGTLLLEHTVKVYEEREKSMMAGRNQSLLDDRQV